MFKRYFDENKKGLDWRIQEGAYVLECETEEDFNRSGDSANIKWDGDTPSLKSKEERDAEILEMRKAGMIQIPKLSIRRAFRSIGKEAELNALIKSSPEMEADWNDAVMIDLSDEFVVQALEGADIDVDLIKEIILNVE
jgi:hypothetical protein